MAKRQSNYRKLSFPVFLLISMISSTACADAIVPALQFFSPFLAIPSLILLIVIIIIEAIMLKILIRPIKFHRHLFYSTIINIVSSVAGSSLGLINYSFAFSDFFWSSLLVTLFLPFIITYVSEFPVVLLFYRKHIFVKKAVWVNLIMNTASYIAFIILLTPVFLTGIMKMSEHLDNKRLKEWSHAEILQNESGKIYALNRLEQTKRYELRNYDLNGKTWETIKQININGHGDVFPSAAWDVSQSFIAYPSDSNSVVVFQKENFTEICKIPIMCDRLKISKSEKQIAILKSFGEVAIQKAGNEWFQLFGRICRIEIFEIPSGYQVCKYGEFVLADGLDWSPDSKKLLFVSLHDNNILKAKNESSENHWDVALYLKESYPKIIYIYDISTNSASELCEGTNPRWNKDGKEFLFIKGDKIFVYNIVTHQAKFLCENYGCSEFYWSASGQNILGFVRTQNPMWTNKYFLTVINIQNPGLKYVIDVGENYYGLNWLPN